MSRSLSVRVAAPHGLTLTSELPLPNRIQSTVYGQQIVLSGDETRVAYIEYQYVASGPGCPGQSAPSACDHFRLLEVGLQGTSAIIGAVDLPAGSYPGIMPAGKQGFAVTLHDSTVVLVGSELKLEQPVSFAQSVSAGPDYHEPTTRPFKAGLATGIVTASGEVVGMTSDGFALHGQQRTRLIPENTWLAGRGLRLGGDRYALPFKTDRRGPTATGVVMVNVATAQVERTVQFPLGGYPLPRPNGEILVLHRGSLGRILATGTAAPSEVPIASVRSDAEVLVP